MKIYTSNLACHVESIVAKENLLFQIAYINDIMHCWYERGQSSFIIFVIVQS